MTAGNRNPPDSPEVVALELFQEIRRAEEKAGENGSNEPIRAQLLGLYAACFSAVRGERGSAVTRH